NGAGRIYGGQVIAQALAAAMATVPEDRAVHSLHAYFLRMGDDARAVDMAVSRDLDGGSFSNRHVRATQDGRVLLSMSASFHKRAEAIAHQDPMPDVPGPEGLPSDAELRRRQAHRLPESRRAFLTQDRALDLRIVEQLDWLEPERIPAVTHTWLRATAPLGEDQRLHRLFLAYASDMAPMRTAAQPHGITWFSGKVADASLDHAIWFHDDVAMDEWLLYVTRSAWAGKGRAHITGQVFTRDGRLVASVAQEGMFRFLA
ncbi:MAG TPA: acyl-CoA thioesterase II, partial [Novosphingobium sp.]|nr:acyl-CoA thioesterase II [Novosphingobium sp.]